VLILPELRVFALWLHREDVSQKIRMKRGLEDAFSRLFGNVSQEGETAGFAIHGRPDEKYTSIRRLARVLCPRIKSITIPLSVLSWSETTP
jgi:hypothetical protein